MSQIFISYSRKDLAIAEKIIDALGKDDLEPWIDWKSIPKGETFEGEIKQGIEKAEVFLFLVSPDSVQSYWCNLEIEHAVQNGKRILPIVVRDTELQIIHPAISTRNWIFCRDEQDDFQIAIEEIQKTIRTDYEWLKYHTKLQLKALEWELYKDTSRLLRGRELQEAEQKLANAVNQQDPQSTILQRQYLLSSRQNANNVRNIFAWSAVGIAIIMVLLFLAALFQRNNALQQAQIALARQLVAQAQSINATRNSRQIIAVLLATHSMEILPSSEASQILLGNLTAHSVYAINQSQDGDVRAVAFSPDNKLIASAGGKTILILETVSGKEIFRLQHNDMVYSIAFSPDGKFLVSGGRDQVVRVWDAVTGSEIHAFQHDGEIRSVTFSPDGKYIVAGGFKSIRIWKATTGTEVTRMKLNTGPVAWVTYSMDGKFVASADQKNVRVWDATTGEEVFRKKAKNH